FSGLNISLAGTGYTLTATSSGLATAKSNAFNVVAGALDHITVSPSNPSVAVSGTQTYTAQGYDSLNNTISGLTYTWSCTNATAGTINSGGVFTSGTAAGSYGNVIQAVSGGKTGTASATVTGAVAAKLAFTTQPGASDTAGTIFSTQPVVTVEDANGSPVTTSGGSITLAITSGTGTSGAALCGAATVNAVNGVATFSGLNISLAGTGYTLTATSSGLTTATSSAFSIAAGALDHITDSPADPWVAVSGTQTYTAQGYDSLNNPISGLTYSWSCTNATAGTINSGGVFTAGTAAGSYGNVIQAVSGGKTGTASVTVTGTVAVKLAFTTQPGASDTAGTVFGTQPVVTVEDANGNPVTANGASISLVITSGTGTNGAALSGSTTENAVNGVATFSGLNVNLAGKGYTLTATSSDMTTATSSAFSIINATVYEGGTSFGGGGSSAAGGNSGEGIVSGGGNSISSSSGSGTTVTTTGVSSSGNEAGVTSIASSIASDGTILSRTEVGSSDGQVSLVIPQGTSFLGPDNSPCTSVSMMPMPVSQQPPAPAGAEIIGLVYNLGPTGSTFEPAASLTFTFNAAQLAGNVNENNMTVAYWDQTSGQWVPLNTEKIDLADGTITAAINHFSTYAILGYQPSPAEFVVSSLTINPSTVNPGEPVNVTVNVANTGEGAGTDSVILNVNGVEWGEQEVALDAGASQNVGFVVTENAATTYDLDINGLVGSFGMTPVTTLIATTAQTTAPVAAVLPLVSTASDSTTATLTNAPSNTPTPVLALTPVQVKKVRLVLLSEILGIALFLILIVTIIILVKRRDLLKKQ
ncbi:MAG: CARDB domain-containing protein, partial [Dehalococcoidales bacterium]